MTVAGRGWWKVALGSGAAMFLAMGLGRFSFAVMIPPLAEAAQISVSESGYVGWINLLGFLLGAFLSEALRRSFSMRLLLSTALCLSVVALAASALPWGFAWLGLWRGLLGITAGLIMVQSLALTTMSAPQGRRARATGFVFAGVGLGIFLPGLLIPLLLPFGLAWAWGSVALVGLCAAVVAQWGWGGALDRPHDEGSAGRFAIGDWPRRALLIAHFLFSFGIVPHTIYWVDFIARDLGQGIVRGGLHWSVAGLFAVAGPWCTTWLAERIGTPRALVVTFLVLSIGIGAPGLVTIGPIIWLSTIIFGAQPGLSGVIAARARDLSTAGEMPPVMRLMVLASGLGAAAGGLVVTTLFAATASYALLFLLGAAALALAAALSLTARTTHH